MMSQTSTYRRCNVDGGVSRRTPGRILFVEPIEEEILRSYTPPSSEHTTCQSRAGSSIPLSIRSRSTFRMHTFLVALLAVLLVCSQFPSIPLRVVGQDSSSSGVASTGVASTGGTQSSTAVPASTGLDSSSGVAVSSSGAAASSSGAAGSTGTVSSSGVGTSSTGVAATGVVSSSTGPAASTGAASTATQSTGPVSSTSLPAPTGTDSTGASTGSVAPSSTAPSQSSSTAPASVTSSSTGGTSGVTSSSSAGAATSSSTGASAVASSSTGLPATVSSSTGAPVAQSSTGTRVSSSTAAPQAQSSTGAPQAQSSTGGAVSSTGSQASTAPSEVSSTGSVVPPAADSSTGLVSSTGSFLPTNSSTGAVGTAGAVLSIPANNTALFLITAGCVAAGVSLIVGLFACFCQRRNRQNEEARKKLEDIRKLETEKSKAKKAKQKLGAKGKLGVKGAGGGGSDADVVDSGPVPFPLAREENKEDIEAANQGEDQSPLLLGSAHDGTGTEGSSPREEGFGGSSAPTTDRDHFGITVTDTAGGESEEFTDGYADGTDAPTSFKNANSDRKRTDQSLANEAAQKARKRQERMAKLKAKQEKLALRNLGQSVSSDDDSPVGDSDFDSEEEDMKYNRHDHVTLEMVPLETSSPVLAGETSLELNSDYSNLVYDPQATLDAAEELARLTGQSVEEVQAMLAEQQQQEYVQTGGAALAGMDPSQMYDPSSAAATAAGADASAIAAAAGVSYRFEDDIPPITHAVTRCYDDVVLAYHGPFETDPYLLSIYSPSHAASPQHVPPTESLHPKKMPYKVVDTHYSRPLPPAAWRLVHGHSPWGATISFSLDHMPKWWSYHKGLDVTESPEEIRRVKKAAKAVANRVKKGGPTNASLSMPMMVKMSNKNSNSNTSSSGRKNIKTVADMGSSSSGSGYDVKPSLRPSRLNPGGGGNADSNLQRRDIHELVRDAPLTSPFASTPSGGMGDSSYPLASPSGFADSPLPPIDTDRSHRRDDEERRGGGDSGRGGGGSSSHYKYSHTDDAADDASDGVSLMGGMTGGGDGSSTYRGYSSFQPMSNEGQRKPKKQHQQQQHEGQQLWRLD